MGIDWIATPAQRDNRYLDALRAIGTPPRCGCDGECRARREWHALIDSALDAWAQDRERMGADRG